ncbi:hypothetical protein GN156_11565 [bacterium LRH843]|nr:hypothetical protein [bacterium LRH843]
MKIGLIHAMTASVEPIETAFQLAAPEASLVHFMDTGLLPLLQQEESLNETVIKRVQKLTDAAAESNVDCIQLTCSAFNELTDILQPFYTIKLFRSDEAMLDQALQYERIGFISTVNETPPVLESYVKNKNANIAVKTLIDTKALDYLLKKDKQTHDERITKLVKEMESQADVIVLTQYSMAHVAKEITDVSIPILTGPEESVKRCLHYIKAKGGYEND